MHRTVQTNSNSFRFQVANYARIRGNSFLLGFNKVNELASLWNRRKIVFLTDNYRWTTWFIGTVFQLLNFFRLKKRKVALGISITTIVSVPDWAVKKLGAETPPGRPCHVVHASWTEVSGAATTDRVPGGRCSARHDRRLLQLGAAAWKGTGAPQQATWPLIAGRQAAAVAHAQRALFGCCLP